jgi:hypothetical protein
MSKELKIVLGIIGVLLVLCCLAGGAFMLIVPRMAEDFMENTVVENPAKAAAVANEIVDHTLPAGYSANMAMSFAGIRMVMIGSEEYNTGQQLIIMLMEYPTAFAGNAEDMKKQMQDSFAQQSGIRTNNMSEAYTEEVVINGQEIQLAVSEGTDNSGNELRQIIGVFESKSGSPAVIMIMGNPASWDTEAYNSFIQSMQTGR